MQYRFGFATCYQGSQDVVGSTGVRWLDYIEVGDIFKFRAEDAWYEVGDVVGQTHIRLTSPYAGPTRRNAEYLITRDFTPFRGYPEVHQGDLDAHWVLTRALRLIDRDIGSGGLIGSGNKMFVQGKNLTGSTVPLHTIVKFVEYADFIVGFTLASATSPEETGRVGIVEMSESDEGIGPGGIGGILVYGIHKFPLTGFQVNRPFYLSDTVGEISSSPGTVQQHLGYVVGVTDGAFFGWFCPESFLEDGKWYRNVRAGETIYGNLGAQFVHLPGETYARFRCHQDGRIEWGDGAEFDSILRRIGPRRLRVNTRFDATRGFTAYYDAVFGNVFNAYIPGEDYARFWVRGDGTIWWSSGAEPLDASFGRIRPNVVGTTDSLEVSGWISSGATVHAQVGVTSSGYISAATTSYAKHVEVRVPTTQPYMGCFRAGEAIPRFAILYDGSIYMSPGYEDGQFTIYYYDENTVGLPGAVCEGTVISQQGPPIPGSFSARYGGESGFRARLSGEPMLEFGPGNAPGDVSLIRLGVGVFGIDGALQVGQTFTSTRADT